MIRLLIATMQVSAILLVAMGMLWLLRRRSASLRHAVIVIAMTCAAIVPALGYVMPRSLTSFIRPLTEGPVVPPFEDFADNPYLEIAKSPVSPDLQSAKPIATNADVAPAHFSIRQNALAPIRIAYGIYIAGVALFLLRLTIGLLRLRWIAAHAEPMRSGRWQHRATAIAIAYRLRRNVTLLRCPTSVLATWGLASPQVLLPAGAEDWPDDSIRAVLLHELAHIRRNDWAIQILAGVLRSIYWFNPLLWLAFARLRQESEQACDDAAISQGEDNAEYAGQLLAIARTLNGAAISPLSAAPSMALRSTLRQRVASVLDPDVLRAPATAKSLTTVSATLLVLTGLVAACDGMQEPPDRRAPPVSEVAEVLSTAVTRPPVEPDPAPAPEFNTTSELDIADAPATANAVVVTTTAEFKAARVPSPDSIRNSELQTPETVAESILELVESALADESLAALDEVQRPITGLHHLQRLARAVADDDERSPAILATRYTEIINALKNTATFASNITSTPRGAQLPKEKVDDLVSALREKAEILADEIMPNPRITTIIVSTPEHRAAISALDLAQSTLRNAAFVLPQSNSWLVNELDTLARAAQSVLSDDGTSASKLATKLYALRGALQSTSRNAENIARRPRIAPDILSHATELSRSVRRVADQLDAALPQPWAPLYQEMPSL